MNSKERLRKISVMGMLCAVAFLAVYIGRIPLVSLPGLTLSYEPKDIIITLGGFIYGPIAAFIISAVVCFIEMITISSTGWVGFAMNLIASAGFACTASYIYKKKHDVPGAIIGLVSGCVVATTAMLLWNYILTPVFMSVSRDIVVKLLIPTFLPFNLVKGGINMALLLAMYKPVMSALRGAKLLPAGTEPGRQGSGKFNVWVLLLATFILTTCVLVAFFILA